MNREPAKAFTDLLVWQKAHSFVRSIYRLSRTFPRSEVYGLTSQLRRAAVSIPANIAEGFGRYGKLDKTRFYKISRGSCYELINQSMASQALGFITDKDKDELTNGYRGVIADLDPMIKSIETSPKK